MQPLCDNAVYCLVPITIHFQYSKFISISILLFFLYAIFEGVMTQPYTFLSLIDFLATLESFTRVAYMPVRYVSIFHTQILSIFQYYSFFAHVSSEIDYFNCEICPSNCLLREMPIKMPIKL